MPVITKPLLAGVFDPAKAQFPYIATPKIDGIRFLMINGVAVSRTFKPIRNKHVQELLQQYLPDGIDGELTCGDTFQSTTSGIMSVEGCPEFKVWVFDYVDPDKSGIDTFETRLLRMPILNVPSYCFELSVLKGIVVSDPDELNDYERSCLESGYEGVMLRDPGGTYKFGRSTVRDNILLKVKRFADAEAELIDIQEKLSNQNPETLDAFGHVKRSHCAGGMVPAGVAGTLVVRDADGNVFGVGSGLDDELRQELWTNRDMYIGRVVKYKYFEQGVKDLPRHPVFLGFRDPEDI